MAYLWNVFCITENKYVSQPADTQITTCPNNASHTIDPDSIVGAIETDGANLVYANYIAVQSGVGDGSGIALTAGDPGGYIQVSGGTGGISENTTGSYQLTAGSGMGTTGGIGIDTVGTVQIVGGTGGITESTTGSYQTTAGSGLHSYATQEIIASPSVIINTTGGTGAVAGATGGMLTTVGGISRIITETVLADSAITATASQVLGGMLSMTPTVTRVLTLPAATAWIAAISTSVTGNSVDFMVRNNATVLVLPPGITVTPGTGGTLIGNGSVTGTDVVSAGFFRIIITSSSTYDLYRVS